MITIQEARKILGKNAEDLSDAELLELINTFTVMSDIAIDQYLLKKKR